MTTLLLANIGNRDVRVSKSAPVPAEVNPLQGEKTSRRALGEYLQSHWSECREHLSLPIIGKAVAYVRQQAGALDGVVLIASDQSGRPDVADKHLQQDTCALAPIVARLLAEQYGVDPAAVAVWNADRPADYGGMQAFFRQHLPTLRDAHPDGLFYLEVSGGTPAMTSMLLTVGAEVFGLAARPLYVSEHEEQPYPLDVGRRLTADALIRALRANVELYAYHAAARTARENADLLGEFIPLEPLLATLEYARQRLNFNFDQARSALDGLSTTAWSAQLRRLQTDLREQQAEWLLHEIMHNAEIKLETGAYGDFLTRVFRFDEAVLRYSALRLGACLVDRKDQPDPDGEFLASDWLESVPGLVEYLQSKNVYCERKVPANRYVLNLVVAFLAEQQEETALRGLCKQLGKLDELAKVRNESFAVHTFKGVSRKRMAQAFCGASALGTDEEIAGIVKAMQTACQTATGQPFTDVNPYTAINCLLDKMLAV